MLNFWQDFVLSHGLLQLEEKRVNVAWQPVKVKSQERDPIHDYRPVPNAICPMLIYGHSPMPKYGHSPLSVCPVFQNVLEVTQDF